MYVMLLKIFTFFLSNIVLFALIHTKMKKALFAEKVVRKKLCTLKNFFFLSFLIKCKMFARYTGYFFLTNELYLYTRKL